MTNQISDAPSTCEGSWNAHLQREVQQRLGESGHFELRRVSVVVDDDHVVLSGTVPSFYLKQIAQETAAKVCPDRRVNNGVHVVH